MSSLFTRTLCTALVVATPAVAGAQRPAATPPANAPSAAVAPAADLPRDYVIGTDDVLEVRFWKDANLSREVTVRPDGKIALELINDVQAAGLTPEQLRVRLMELAKQFVAEPNVSVVVRQINSRKVFITGMVDKPGSYPLTTEMTVLHLISVAGGLREFAKQKDIVVMRSEKGTPLAYPFNYEDVRKGKRLTQNITLKPGDTVVVP